MNWQRGFFRFWLVVSVLWGLILGFWAYVSFQTVVAIARSFGITGSDWLVLLLALAAPVLVLLIAGLIFVWIVRGFRA